MACLKEERESESDCEPGYRGGERRNKGYKKRRVRQPWIERRNDWDREWKKEQGGTGITTYAIRASNCWQRVTGDYFLIAAIKRTRSPRIGACVGTV